MVKLGETSKDENLFGAKEAFHICAVFVTSSTIVRRGQPLKLDFDGRHARDCGIYPPDGHADLELKEEVKPGVGFWMLLNKSKTKDMTHSFKIEGVVEPKPAIPYRDRYYDSDEDRCYSEGC